MQAQSASPTFTHVYAALVAIINTKFPQIGELLLKRLVIQFRKGFRRNNKDLCLSSVRFVAHLVNQQVVCINVLDFNFPCRIDYLNRHMRS
jgi:pre-mRNA-splicing factor CWC22